MENLENIIKNIEPILERNEVLLSDIKWINNNGKILQISIEKKDGSMDIDTCEKVSEDISPVIDNIIDMKYTLEVCSPGAEREIKDLNKLNNYIGKHIYVRFKHPLEKKIELFGDIEEAGECLKLKYKDKTRVKYIEIDLDNIEKARFAVNI